MRIVLDTNVVVSALIWGGTPYRQWEAIRGQPAVALAAELFEVPQPALVDARIALMPPDSPFSNSVVVAQIYL